MDTQAQKRAAIEGSEVAAQVGNVSDAPRDAIEPQARSGNLATAVIGITGTPALPAKIKLAIDMHRRYSTEITALGIIDTGRIDQTGPVPVGAISFARDMRERRLMVSKERATASLKKVADGCAEAGVPVRCTLVEDEPIEAISRQT